jgi:lysylphosphatidylglycerol synthetase-like protein (DUF2156 family)
MGESTGVEIRHPNRETASAKATKAAVVLLLVVSAALILIVTAGGWANLQGAQAVAIIWIGVYLLMAFYVTRWNRGVLPVASALAILLAVLGAVAAPSWFDRDKTGFHNPGIAPGVLGLVCLLIIPVSVLLIAFAMRGFSQKWNVEVEVPRDEDRYDEPPRSEPRAATG